MTLQEIKKIPLENLNNFYEYTYSSTYDLRNIVFKEVEKEGNDLYVVTLDGKQKINSVRFMEHMINNLNMIRYWTSSEIVDELITHLKVDLLSNTGSTIYNLGTIILKEESCDRCKLNSKQIIKSYLKSKI